MKRRTTSVLALFLVFVAAWLVIIPLVSCTGRGNPKSYKQFYLGDDIELRYWTPWWTWGQVDQAGELPLYQELEKLTGVRVAFEHPDFTQTEEQNLATLQSSSDLPDIIEWDWTGLYPGGPEQAISDGIITKLDDVISSYAPNLWKIITGDEEVARWITTGEGSFYAFPHLRLSTLQRVAAMPFFKVGWLEAIGKSAPVTLEEWYDVLVAMKGHDYKTRGQLQEYPLLLLTYKPVMSGDIHIYLLRESNFFAGAFGVSHGFFIRDGDLHYGPIQPEYHEMLRTLADWYAQGLVHPVLSDPETTFRHPFEHADFTIKSGVWISDTWFAGFVSPFRLVSAPLPGHNRDNFVGQMVAPVNDGERSAAVSATTENKTDAVRWLDLAYSEEGHILFNFGLEEETFRYEKRNPVLKPEITDEIRSNFTSGAWWRNSLLKYSRAFAGGPYVLSDDLMSQYASATGLDRALANADFGERAQIDPEAVLNQFPSKQRDYQAIMTDIVQYQIRNFCAFISGQKSLEDYSEYVRTITAMGIEQAKEILTEAWRNFYSKPLPLAKSYQ